MQQHPVPQNVTQYQFRLVGDMTLKQFLELMAGILLAYLFFASNLVFIFKWPLVIFSLLFGVGLAFFPIEDRPLDQWIINFVHAIYAPTRFIWQKTNKIPPLFLFLAHSQENVNTVTKTIKAPSSTPAPAPVSDLSVAESAQVASVDALFAALPASLADSSAAGQPPKIVFNRPSIQIRKLHAPAGSPPLPRPPGLTMVTRENPTSPTKASATPIPSSAISDQPLDNNVVFQAPSIHATQAPTTNTPPKSIALPAAPKLPNLVTGIVVDQAGKLVENAIVQIVDQAGIPARAIKTNSLGRFFTSTPLSPGTYAIEVDRAGLQFTPQQLVVNNAVIPPFELRATT